MSNTPRSRLLAALLSALLAGVLVVWLANLLILDRPVNAALTADSRNDGYTIRAHFDHYVVPGTLVLDLTAVESAAPVDVFRGLFQAADTLASSGKQFEKVVLARNGKSVFIIPGDKFRNLGAAYGSGENSLYLLRTLPEQLLEPDGSNAYGTWTGGVFGVFRQQMEDVNDAARHWMNATERLDDGL